MGVISHFLNQYYIIEKINSGGYSDVYKVVDVLTKTKYALKLMSPESSESLQEEYDSEDSDDCIETTDDEFNYEVAAHRVLSNSDFVVGMYDHGEYIPIVSCTDEIISAANAMGYKDCPPVASRYFFIITELMDGVLCDLIEKRKHIHPKVFSLIILQMFQGLKYIHQCDMSHRDIKPENILYRMPSPPHAKISMEDCLKNYEYIKANLAIKYADLGFTCTDLEHLEKCGDARICKMHKGTAEFIDPNLIKNKNDVNLSTTQASDIWSLAITIWEFIYNDTPFCLGQIIKLTQKQIDEKIIKTSGNNNMIVESVLKRMLRVLIVERLTIEEGITIVSDILYNL